MKAKLSGKITRIERLNDGHVGVRIVLDGKMAPTDEERLAATQLANVKSYIILRLPQLVADELRFGQALYFTISDEEP